MSRIHTSPAKLYFSIKQQDMHLPSCVLIPWFHSTVIFPLGVRLGMVEITWAKITHAKQSYTITRSDRGHTSNAIFNIVKQSGYEKSINCWGQLSMFTVKWVIDYNYLISEIWTLLLMKTRLDGFQWIMYRLADLIETFEN